MGGGQRFDRFVAKHFTKTGPAADSRSNRSAEELEAEFDRLRVASFDTQGTNQLSKPIRCGTPPFDAKLHEMYNLEEITTIRKGVTPQSATEDLMVHDQNEQPGAWDPIDILVQEYPLAF